MGSHDFKRAWRPGTLERTARTEQLENKSSEEKELGCQARNLDLRRGDIAVASNI